MKYATVVGSREIPSEYQLKMIEIINLLNKHGYIIRSGGAPGTDSLVTKHGKLKDIFVPWFNFSGTRDEIVVSRFHNYQDARQIAATAHPYWERLSDAARKLHTRNVYQVLGHRLNTPSEFVICYTPDGATKETSELTGGTGQAIRIANTYGVKVYNIMNDNDFLVLKELLR